MLENSIFVFISLSLSSSYIFFLALSSYVILFCVCTHAQTTLSVSLFISQGAMMCEMSLRKTLFSFLHLFVCSSSFSSSLSLSFCSVFIRKEIICSIYRFARKRNNTFSPIRFAALSVCVNSWFRFFFFFFHTYFFFYKRDFYE